MSDVLAPLVALEPAHAAFVAVAVGGHRPIRPLIWNEWTQSTTPTPIQNTAVNRSMDESEPLPQIDRVDGIVGRLATARGGAKAGSFTPLSTEGD